MTKKKTEVILALDVETQEQAKIILDQTGEKLSWIKIGLQTYLRDGPDFIRSLADDGKRIFLDLKLHDIPNTMAKALESLSRLPVELFTLHASAGPEALQRCAEFAKDSMPSVTLLGVTVLTSMNEENLRSVGIPASSEQQVERLAKMATDVGIGGIVCSPLELNRLRGIVPSETILVTPGIRPSGAETGDQKRIMTPKQAQQAGANFLVIGRPILSSPDPAQALAIIHEELES
ncbi:MAG: orotidine-5'-phosphate decarboxylase [Verrucomicrobiota bacterium]|nr:orotidine-5'-phosphate decarboxylase [Verrucomicrobiota bacterium]